MIQQSREEHRVVGKLGVVAFTQFGQVQGSEVGVRGQKVEMELHGLSHLVSLESESEGELVHQNPG